MYLVWNIETKKKKQQNYTWDQKLSDEIFLERL